MHIRTSKTVSESYPSSSLNCLISHSLFATAIIPSSPLLTFYNSKIMLAWECLIIPRNMLRTIVTYNSQSYAGILGSGPLYYPPISMHYSQNYSQDYCQSNPRTLKMILCCKAWLFYWSNIMQLTDWTMCWMFY